MAGVVVIGNVETLAHPNLVKLSGTVKDTGKNLCNRTVQAYKSGTPTLIDETESDATTGVFSMLYHGESGDKVRIEAFADEAVGDENSQVFDFVNPVQHTTIV